MVDKMRTTMKFIPFLIFSLLMSSLVYAQDTGGTMEQKTLTHDNRERNYLVYTPTDYDTSQDYTLLLALHPASTTAQQMADMTQFNTLADKNNVLMVFPDSVGGRWNSSNMMDIDDLGFISALLDTLIADYAIDASQVYVLGYSNGGLMTHKLRCVMAERITGMISYAAPMTFAIANDCESANPVSALVIHGTSDEVFPYSGQAGYSDGRITGTFSADQTIGFLAGLNDCRTQSEGADISDDNARNRVFLTVYPCDDTITELYTIAGLGHFGWAGTLPLKLDSKTVTLNQAIFQFINRVRGLS